MGYDATAHVFYGVPLESMEPPEADQPEDGPYMEMEDWLAAKGFADILEVRRFGHLSDAEAYLAAIFEHSAEVGAIDLPLGDDGPVLPNALEVRRQLIAACALLGQADCAPRWMLGANYG